MSAVDEQRLQELEERVNAALAAAANRQRELEINIDRQLLTSDASGTQLTLARPPDTELHDRLVELERLLAEQAAAAAEPGHDPQRVQLAQLRDEVLEITKNLDERITKSDTYNDEQFDKMVNLMREFHARLERAGVPR